MAGAQFEYDERGTTFYYFLISFYALVLVPTTYYFFPKGKSSREKSTDVNRCHCEGCEYKETKKKSKQPWSNLKHIFIQTLIILGWIGFLVLAYKVSHIEVEHIEYDPFLVLELDQGASDTEVKKAYRKLSLKHHPDRGGDPQRFVAISKAYQALTNEESKENFAKYGNPDGPGATTFGIALPKWLVSKEYGVWVLAFYVVLFMIVLPVGVGIWWYNSIKYSADQVLLDTTHLYGYMFHKTANVMLKRIIMILGASFEFFKAYNKEVVERPSDDREVPLLIKELPNLSEKSKEKPLCYPYSLKARALIHAHLSRLHLPADTLDQDREYILRKCPILLQEMIQVISQLVMLASAGRVQRMPQVDTVENVMKLSTMLVQALWDKQSPLLQLPHFTEDMLRYCVTKRRRVKTCMDMAMLNETERRALFRNLSDSQCADIRNVLAAMPAISMETRVEVQGEDDKHTITAGSLVTVHVKLTRKSLLETSGTTTAVPAAPAVQEPRQEVEDEQEEENESVTQNGEAGGAPVKQRKPWEKQTKKKKQNKNTAAKNKKKPPPPPPPPKRPTPPQQKEKEKEKTNSKKNEEKESDWESEDEGCSSDGSSSDETDVREAINETRKPNTDDEDEFDFDDDLLKKERILETKSKITHPVHSPLFPEEKFEWWWVYLCDRKHRLLLSGPVSVTTLVSEEDTELKFPAPSRPGTYSFQVCLRSDSYVDADQVKDIKLVVEEAREVTSHPQWNFPSDEEENKSESEPSDASEYTEDEDDD